MISKTKVLKNSHRNYTNKGSGFLANLILVFFLASMSWVSVGCTHPKTPAGHEGYIFHKPLIFGKAEYRKILTGPSSTGLSWRLYVINVDMRAKSYQEDFQLLTSDNLSVKFEVNTRISLRPNSSKKVVERWGGEKWFEWNVKEPLRTTVRREITRISAIQIQLKTNAVRQTIYERLLKMYEGTPVQIESVDIGNIQFPTRVTRAIEKKIGQQQELERQEYMLAKTKKEAAIKVLESLKAAKQQIIISSTLNPLYVQRMAVGVYKKLAESSNKTVIMLPNSADGTGLPIVLDSQETKTLSPEDKKFLEEMENKYMKIAKKQKLPLSDDMQKGVKTTLPEDAMKTEPSPPGTEDSEDKALRTTTKKSDDAKKSEKAKGKTPATDVKKKPVKEDKSSKSQPRENKENTD